MKLLSVIIPTYNMERYLENCLTSFIDDKEELFNKIEVIVVNDGSMDHSLEIANQFADKYPDVFRIIDKKNGGHGSTINQGVLKAKGKYFRVVDADDWVNTREFYKFLSILDSTDTDIVFTPYSSVDAATGRSRKYRYNTKGIEQGKVCPIDIFIKDRLIRMHTITYRTELLQRYHIQLDEHCFYVDTEYVIYPLKYVKTCLLINANVYCYRINLTTQSCSDEGYFKHKKDHEKVALNLLRFVSKEIHGKTSTSKKKYYYRYVSLLLEKQYRIYLMEDIFSRKNKRELELFDARIKRINPKIYYKLSKIKYIKELRALHFHFILYHKWKFNIMKNMEKYPGLDF